MVGSGASGVHFALTALQRGHQVLLLDVGYERPKVPLPDATFDGLKSGLDDPVRYFLGTQWDGVTYPKGGEGSFYQHPPSKSYVFHRPATFPVSSDAINPHFTFARGGFAEAWTAGVYPFTDDDLAAFPFGYEELRPHYLEVARRIGIAAEHDDLAQFMPFDAEYLPPLDLDSHSRHLLGVYARKRMQLHQRLGFFLGRSRVATLSVAYGGRKECSSLGRCLWGCPHDAIYRPSVTLAECATYPGFTYRPGVMVKRFDYDVGGNVTGFEAASIDGKGTERHEADVFVLAAGGLPTSKIYLESLRAKTGHVGSLPGLMDNRQIHIPFLTPAMIGRDAPSSSYQFHHLAFGMPQANPAHYVHGQITTLKAAGIHPIVQSIPLDLRTSLRLFQAFRAGLGVANINLHDSRRSDSHVTLQPDSTSGLSRLILRYASDPAEAHLIDSSIATVKRALRSMGSFVPPGMTRILPKGWSVHYTGTLPMQEAEAEHTCRPNGRVNGFLNLYVADGAAFPFLPAKNLTFTLMANAVRIAEAIP